MKKRTAAALDLAMVLVVSVSGAACRKGALVEMTQEDGVEVVVNHLEPSKLLGVPSTLRLEEVFSIDTEREEIAGTGLTSAEWFCLDRDGNIYLMMRESPGDFVYKFDAGGKFVRSFAHKGQGPGELGYGGDILTDGQGNLIAKDMSSTKYSVFTPDGRLVRDVEMRRNLEFIKALGGPRFLAWLQVDDPEKPILKNHYSIFDAAAGESREFYTYEFDHPYRAARLPAPGTLATIAVEASDDRIFIGDTRDGYVIRVFDLSGKLVRKIRKDYRPVAFPDSYKRDIRRLWESRGALGQEMLRKIWFPAHLPPFRFLFSDGEGRLFVMTNERDAGRGYLYDIFTKDGVFIGRFGLDNLRILYIEGHRYRDEPLHVETRGDLLYCLREKDNGYVVLTAYRMRWI